MGQYTENVDSVDNIFVVYIDANNKVQAVTSERTSAGIIKQNAEYYLGVNFYNQKVKAKSVQISCEYNANEFPMVVGQVEKADIFRYWKTKYFWM